MNSAHGRSEYLAFLWITERKMKRERERDTSASISNHGYQVTLIRKHMLSERGRKDEEIKCSCHCATNMCISIEEHLTKSTLQALYSTLFEAQLYRPNSLSLSLSYSVLALLPLFFLFQCQRQHFPFYIHYWMANDWCNGGIEHM